MLIVEDEPNIMESLSFILQRADFDIDTAPDGTEALRQLRRHAYSALILDLMLPGMDGGELVERALDLDPTIRVLLTVDTDNPEAVELHGGYHDFAWVRKPITFTALANRLDELFTRRPAPSYASPMGPPARTWRRSGQFRS